MPATMEVRENGRALYFVFSAPLTPQHLIEMMAKDQQYRDSVPYKVHAVINAAHADMPPSAFRARSSPSIVHPRRGYCLVVGTSGVVRAIADTIFKIAHNDTFQFFDTDEQAWEFLRGKLAGEGETITS